uniref:BTB domain-containing protein n=1 Tax=Panagrolaimus sp. ES5 TaxID=591445 RepID=A0AC34FNX5_9BILA
MESSNNEIVCPFEIEFKFKKSDLIALKDYEIGFLCGKYFYAFNIPGLQYYIKIYPNGDDEQHLGETWIFLNVNGSKERKITAQFTISIESANYSKSFNYVYETHTGWGSTCCKTVEFFESKNKYFVDGEIKIKVKGIFKTERSSIQKSSTPISMQWKIKEDVLLPKKGIKNGRLFSKRRNVPSLSGVKYYLDIFPNEINDGAQPKTWKIEAACDFSVDSANYKRGYQYIFEESEGYGLPLCSTDDLFDPTKRYIVDGFLTINFNGILLAETDEKIETNFKKKAEDFTIVIVDKEIKVHKQVLMDSSPVLNRMFESRMNESIENRMIIPDFPFEIVNAAIKLCYNSDFSTSSFTIEDLLSLFKFADKYEIILIMDLVENDLMKKISPSNVVQLIHFTKSLTASKLYQSCINFLLKCSKESTPVLGVESLGDRFLATCFLETFRSVDSDAESDNYEDSEVVDDEN